jgi:hypothetical protein
MADTQETLSSEIFRQHNREFMDQLISPETHAALTSAAAVLVM